MSIMRKVEVRLQRPSHILRTTRVAAAAVLAFLLGGVVVYKSVEPVLEPRAVAITQTHAPQPLPVAKASDELQVPRDPWQSDELKDFHNVVQWESWVADSKSANGESSL